MPVNGTPATRRVTKGLPMPAFKEYGTDSSGRKILMTPFMHDWFEAIVRELGFRPTIVQGAWMRFAGGGATESAGYHDGGGCLDLRVWDLTATQQQAVVHAFRWGGAGGWIRDKAHGGFDPHFHLVLGSDVGLSAGAAWQWLNYIHGGDGLSSGGRDYHPRPNPLVTEPPKSLMEEDIMQPEDFDKIATIAKKAAKEAVAEQTDAIAKATAKALLNSDVISRLDVSVREALRAAFNDSNKANRKG